MRIRPRDPQKELTKTERQLADAEHDYREQSYRKRPSWKMKRMEEINELKAKVERLRELVG